MKSFVILFLIVMCVALLHAAPTPSPQKTAVATANKGAFNSGFDEIVVESSLTVRGKNPGQRQGRKLVVIPANESITVKTSLSSPSSSSPPSTTAKEASS